MLEPGLCGLGVNMQRWRSVGAAAAIACAASMLATECAILSAVSSGVKTGWFGISSPLWAASREASGDARPIP